MNFIFWKEFSRTLKALWPSLKSICGAVELEDVNREGMNVERKVRGEEEEDDDEEKNWFRFVCWCFETGEDEVDETAVDNFKYGVNIWIGAWDAAWRHALKDALWTSIFEYQWSEGESKQKQKKV